MNTRKNPESAGEDSQAELLALMQAANKVSAGCHAVHAMLIKEAKLRDTGVSDEENVGTIFLKGLEGDYQEMLTLKKRILGITGAFMRETSLEESGKRVAKCQDEYRVRMCNILGVVIDKHPRWETSVIENMIQTAGQWGFKAARANIIMKIVGSNEAVLQAFRDSLAETPLDEAGSDE